MDMTLRILGRDERYRGVVRVQVPGIYPKGSPLPAHMARLVEPAAEALARVYQEIVAEGGHLYISDMFRSAEMQQKAHEDWKAGRKTAYSPPACGSVHESGRAIDTDALDTGIAHKLLLELLNRHGLANNHATLTGPECWHSHDRHERWERERK